MTTLSPKLTYLSQTLQAIDVAIDVSTLETRILMQKAVYIAQQSGSISRLYEFCWDLFGPYSGVLAEDYHTLANTDGQQDPDVALRTEAIEGLSRLNAKLREAPAGLSRVQWFELLASTLFLSKELLYSDEQISEVIKLEKPILSPYLSIALSFSA